MRTSMFLLGGLGFFSSLSCREAPQDTGLFLGECSEASFEATSAYLLDPLFEASHQWSCTHCHNPGIDPTLWSQQTACQTMSCYIDNAFVDFEQMADSEIMMRIHQAELYGRISTDLSTMRRGDIFDSMLKESDAFLRWIQYGSECFFEACSAEAQSYTGVCGYSLNWGDCNENKALKDFEDQIYAPLVDGCAQCHSEGGSQTAEFSQAPHFLTLDPTAGPQVTLNWTLEKSLIQLSDPSKSKILTRPLAEGTQTSSPWGDVVGVWHGGGDIWFPDSSGGMGHTPFDSIIEWIQEYGGCISP